MVRESALLESETPLRPFPTLALVVQKLRLLLPPSVKLNSAPEVSLTRNLTMCLSVVVVVCLSIDYVDK